MRVISSLQDHPHREDIAEVRKVLGGVTLREVALLAAAWQNTPTSAKARACALAIDAPLIVDVLQGFEAIDELQEELVRELQWLPEHITMEPSIVLAGVKAIRDALAAAYARPILSQAGYEALAGPFARVMSMR